MTNKHYSIVVGIEITNMTRYHVIKPKTKTYSGYISTPAVSVRPGYKEAMVNIFHVLFYLHVCIIIHIVKGISQIMLNKPGHALLFFCVR